MLEPLLTARQCADHLQIGLRTLQRMIAEGRFPQGIQITPRMLRWPESVVRQWQKDLLPQSGEFRV